MISPEQNHISNQPYLNLKGCLDRSRELHHNLVHMTGIIPQIIKACSSNSMKLRILTEDRDVVSIEITSFSSMS